MKRSQRSRSRNRLAIRSSTRRINLDPSGSTIVTQVPNGMDLGAATVTPASGIRPDAVGFPVAPQQSPQ